MAKFKTYNYRQRVFLPVSLEDQLMSRTLEFAIHTLVEKRLDMSIFEGKYCNDATGRAAYDSKILLKVVLLAYSRGLISSRKIEQACRENVVFMALTCGQQLGHSTIAAFVSSMKDEILSLFRDVLLVCEEMNLLGGTMFALDSCKLPSNASKEWSLASDEATRADMAVALRRLAEEIREREQADKDIARLATFPQLNPNPILEIDINGKITFYNAAILQVLANLGLAANIEAFLPQDMAAILKEPGKPGKTSSSAK